MMALVLDTVKENIERKGTNLLYQHSPLFKQRFAKSFLVVQTLECMVED